MSEQTHKMSGQIFSLIRLYDEKPDLCLVMIDVAMSVQLTPLNEIQLICEKANLDPFFFETIKKSLINGNFDVLYLDDRMVGDDPKRIKAQKELQKIKSDFYKQRKNGKHTFEILLEQN